jgi:4-amino-4-deoxy-L-arabinose transferase-like glycosyltransferase
MSWSGETGPWRAALGAGRALVRRDAWGLPVLALLFGLAAGLQIASGAHDADFCGYPDESAHFVTSVMVGEFLRAPVERPMAFASRYYAQYPKLGIGHWPPLGYAMQGASVLVFGSSRGAVLTSLLVFAVVSAWVVYELSRHEEGRLVAAAAAAAWLVNAHVQQSYEQTMMDMPAAALCLLAVLAFRVYVNRPGVATGLLFGTLACGALLVKQQAVVLALMPVAYVLMGRSPGVIRRTDFWVAAVPTLLVAVPWYVLSTPIFYDNPARWAGLADRGALTNRLS